MLKPKYVVGNIELTPKHGLGTLTVKQNDEQLKATLVPFVKGEKGDPGANAAGFDYTQGSANAIWTIAHNLGFKPTTSVFTVGGVEMYGTVTHISNNVLQVSFSTDVAGYARLN